MDDLRLEAFFQELEELEKSAGLMGRAGSSLLQGAKTFGKLFYKPGEALREGWAGMAPNAKEIAERGLNSGRTGLGGLADRGAASGWTGSGGLVGHIPWAGKHIAKVTKYLPLGQKSLFTGVTAASAPALYKGIRGQDGENMESSLETAGSNLGWVVGSPAPILGNIAGVTALSAGGKYLGRGVDRLLGRKAPTLAPTAPEQLGSVQRFGE
jgi:hypothetical protein